jgi:hypothetical protein
MMQHIERLLCPVPGGVILHQGAGLLKQWRHLHIADLSEAAPLEDEFILDDRLFSSKEQPVIITRLLWLSKVMKPWNR